MAHLAFIFRSFPWGLLAKVYLKLINEILWPSARSRPWERVSKGLPGSCHYCFDASREALDSIAANLHRGVVYVGLGSQKGLHSYPGLFVGIWSLWNSIYFYHLAANPFPTHKLFQTKPSSKQHFGCTSKVDRSLPQQLSPWQGVVLAVSIERNIISLPSMEPEDNTLFTDFSLKHNRTFKKYLLSNSTDEINLVFCLHKY